MRMIAAAMAAGTALAACTERGRVEVVAFNKYEGGPAAGALVVFTDVDGGARTAEIGGDGRASGEVEAGGSVWLFVDRPPEVSPGPYISAYTDVQPGDTLEFGPLPREEHEVRATMTVVGTRPAGTSGMGFTSNCSTPREEGQALELDDRCGPTANVVIYAYEYVSFSGLVLRQYISLPAQPIINGGTIAIDPSAWKTPELVTIDFLNSGGPVEYVLSSVPSACCVQKGLVPLVGELRAVGKANGHEFTVMFPSTSTHNTLDLDGMLPPSVTTDRSDTGDVQWAIADDANGARIAHAVTAEYTWKQPIANYELAMELRIVSPVTDRGQITTPRLPEPLSKYQPRPDFQVFKRGFLHRVEGMDPALVRRIAESSPLIPPDLFEVLAATPAWSSANTLLF